MAGKFSTFQDIARNANTRDLVLFGAGDIATKTLRKLDRPPVFIVDNNPNTWGMSESHLEVKSPNELKDLDTKSVFVIICTTSFEEVSEQLNEFGFETGYDFIVSPVLNDLRIISELESLNTRLLFTSGGPTEDAPDYGGGIYELTVSGDTWHHKKVFDGSTHGIIKFEDRFIATNDKLGIVELDSDYKLVRHGEIPPGSRPHGIAYSEITRQFYVVTSHMDTIFTFDRDFKPVDKIPISHKFGQEGESFHHCNDICIVGNSIYVSMFSYTGNWKRDVYDGVVLEIDLLTRQIYRPVITDLWMPHNIVFMGGSLTVLDSLRGQLKRHNAQVLGQFPCFTRGIAHDGAYFYIGQSKNRNFSKYLGLSNNISIDASIIVFDEQTKVSRSLFLPPKVSEIHAILSLAP